MARPEAKLKELKPADLKQQVAARRDLVVTINRRSDARLVACGDEFLYQKLPVGTRVINSPPPLDELPDADQAIRYALLRPENSDPLFAQLSPNLRVTIAIDDLCTPLPQMRRPDIRERILSAILQTLGDYGVDDVHLVIASGLRRRLTGHEIRRIVGDRIFKQFWPERLYNFDAENKSELVGLGKTERNEEVWISRRLAESDLFIDVSLRQASADLSRAPGLGLTPYQTICHLSEADGGADRISGVINEHVNVFAVGATANNRMYGPALDFLHKNEDSFNDWDRTRLKALRWALENMSNELRRRLAQQYSAPYGLTGVWAGRPDAVRHKAVARAFQQHAVPVKGQTDILILGIPSAGPYNANSIMNPILVQALAMGHLFGMHRGKPLVREGGTLIVCHPLRDEFHPEHHPSYIEFFHRCLAESRDAGEFEAEFARNPTYIHMYRYGHAYHGAHPFQAWQEGAAARGHLGRVIAAGCEERHVAARLGWDAADTLDEAIALATSDLGHSSTITYLHAPPAVITDVE